MKLKRIRTQLQNLFRKIGLLKYVEQLRFYLKKRVYQKQMIKFKNENSNFLLPPEYLAFDAYSAPDWYFYQESGVKTAIFLTEITQRYCSTPIEAVYEWGCGPARVIRHLPDTMPKNTKIFGSDYNPETIDWCQKNILSVKFDKNELRPPLIYEANKFDFIYAISVFTHLSEEVGLLWINELKRILKPSGIILITTATTYHYDSDLSSTEKSVYNQKGIVVRGNYEEGKKMFLTYHSINYIKNTLLVDFQILEHQPIGFPMISQDHWIARKI